jgi:hypothetical protein
MNRGLDAFVGGWDISLAYRVTSSLPFSVGNGQRWPTEWEVSDIATPSGIPIPPVVSTGNSTLGGPNLWKDPKAAFRVVSGDHRGAVGKPQPAPRRLL